MSVSNRIARARRLAGVDSNQYPDTDAIVDLNAVYHEIEDAIVAEQEDFFWDYFKSNTVVGQSEYSLPASTDMWADWSGTNKLLQLSIKYNTTDDYYTKVRRTDIYNMDREMEWYEENQPSSDPIYHISDNSYFVYPAPTTAVTNGIKGVIVKELRDLTTSDAASDIFNGKISPKYHSLIELGMLESIYGWQQKPNEAIKARNDFEKWLKNLTDRIGNRYEEPMESEMPNINYLG